MTVDQAETILGHVAILATAVASLVQTARQSRRQEQHHREVKELINGSGDGGNGKPPP